MSERKNGSFTAHIEKSLPLLKGHGVRGFNFKDDRLMNMNWIKDCRFRILLCSPAEDFGFKFCRNTIYIGNQGAQSVHMSGGRVVKYWKF